MTTIITPVPRSEPDNGCLVSLRNSGAEFDTLTSVGNGRCRVDVPVRLHSISTTSGKIALPESPILSCRFARQFALWLSDTGAALVSTHLDNKMAKISTGPGYECRGRNGSSSAKLSEHAFGNAVDITTITTGDGRKIQISDAGSRSSPSFQVLRGLRTTACGYFSTVLGPGSNEAHASHFHFDIGMHGRSKNYRICE
ncbi:MAG: extensin family protein [Rhizobiales bacterium]|nr:extensin family protein [Hyphomicrobiales bacterium]